MTTSRQRLATSGFSFVEIMVAVAILAVSLIPVVNLSTQAFRESGSSREDILARHLLLDLVERYKNASIPELGRLPASPADRTAVTGDEGDVENDSVLRERTARLLGLARSVGSEGPRVFQSYGDLNRGMQIRRRAFFDKDSLGQGRHVLWCVVTWTSLSGHRRSVDFAKVVVRPS